LIPRVAEDSDLVLAAQRGDVEAFNRLIGRWEKRIFNYLLRILGDREDAMDVSQDVFLKAYQKIRSLQDADRFSYWLFRIAHNEAFSLVRKSKPEEEWTGQGDGPEWSRRMASVEVSLAVESALARLSPEQREAVVLKVCQGFKFEEIAEILGAPVSTVKSRLYTGLDVLRRVLEPLAERPAKER
jgi:RNA polymerase sigma-70 factor (ECF subfamily)